jgi:AraC-like DNA-binding protein
VSTLLRFSTLGLTRSSQVEMWEDHNARALVGLECRTIDGLPLEATETNLHFDSLQFAHVTANAHVVERSSRSIAKTSTDGVILYFTLFGESFFYYRDGVLLQRPGGLLVCDVNEPFMRGFARGLQEFALKIPRSVFDEIADDPMPRHPVTMSFSGIAGTNAHALALATLVKSTFAGPIDDEHLARTEATAMGLLRAIFSEDEARGAAAHRRAALDYLDRHLRDPRLSVAQIARALGVSERHIARIFAETGVGLSRVMLERRLDLALSSLSKPNDSRSIGEIAASCGFNSQAHFTRVFRERYEETPGQLRSRLAQG